MALIYVVYFAQLTSVPFQDFPNHLARAEVLADLIFRDGARFGSQYAFHFAPVPYVLHDLVFATLIEVFGQTIGVALFTTIVLLSLPCALLFYMHAARVAPRARMVVFLLSLFLATDWFFLMAFLAFRLAVAFVIVCLAIAEMLRRRGSLAGYAVYIAALVLGYLTHLTATVFFALVIGVSAVVRLATKTSSFSREAQLVVPVLALLAFHFGVNTEPRHPNDPIEFLYNWGRLDDKVIGLWYEFARFGGRTARPMVLLLVLCVGLAVWRQLRPSALKSPRVIENVLIACAFGGLYILLPREYADSTYVDIRALAMIALFILIASLWLVEATEGRGYDTLMVRVLAVALVAVNFRYIVVRVSPLEQWFERYREVVASVPVGARALPVSTLPKVGTFTPTLHAGSFLVTDRAARMPYLFSRDRGDAMKYFHYRGRLYMPQENWYREHVKWQDGHTASYTVLGRQYTWQFKYSPRDQVWEPLTLVPVDWSRLACDYDLMVVSRPYDAQLIEVSTSVVTQNDAAALLAVDKSACRPSEPSQTVRLPSEH